MPRTVAFRLALRSTLLALTCGALDASDEAAAPKVEDLVGTPPVVWMPKPAVDVPDAQAAAEADMKLYSEKIPGTKVTFDMVPIKGGSFRMGSPPSEAGRDAGEGPQFEAELEPFWIGKCEVTWAEYELWGIGLDSFRRAAQKAEATAQDKLADAVTRPTPPYADMAFGMGKQGRPAISMTQFAAKVYCKWLSAKTGRYYRLPTAAEWEYACRAGTTTAYSFGDDPKLLGDHAWFAGNSGNKYHEVGKKKPNPWGLYDMHGNVSEWVLDQFMPEGYAQFAGTRQKNPLAVPTKVEPRTVCGGSWVDTPERLRSAAREGSEKSWKEQDPQIPQSIWYYTDADFAGFRVVRPLRIPTAEEAARYDVDAAEKAAFEEYSKARGYK